MQFTKFTQLKQVIKTITTTLGEKILKKLEEGSYKINLDSKNIVIGKKGIYCIEGGICKRILIHMSSKIENYITKNSKEEYYIDILNRYHFLGCDKIKEQIQIGKKDLYHTNIREDRTFKYHIIKEWSSNETRNSQKLACSDCLGKGIGKNRIWK